MKRCSTKASQTNGRRNMLLGIVEKTTHLEKLTANVVREFIDKIVVHHRKEENGVTTQKVEIYYNVIAKFELPPVYELMNFSSMAEVEESLAEKIIA